MRVSVWSHDSNPTVDPRLFKQSILRCEEGVRDGFLQWLDVDDKSRGCIQTTHLRELERGISSRTTAVPFIRIQNRLQKPTVNGYPIPAVGDHRLRWLYSFMISETAKADSY